jgi:hypothetical protein
MKKKLLVVMLLSLTLAACEPSGAENNSNGNSNAKPATPAASSPAAPSPVSPSPEPSASVKAPVKAGDKVKITVNGVATAATVVSVDEKSGKVTVRVEGGKEEKTVAIADVIKE